MEPDYDEITERIADGVDDQSKQVKFEVREALIDAYRQGWRDGCEDEQVLQAESETPGE